MIILDRLLVGSIRFVLDKLAQAVDEQLNDDSVLKQRLLEAQMQLEVGELSEEEFKQIEADVMAHLREIQERRQGGETGPIELQGKKASVEATFEADEEH